MRAVLHDVDGLLWHGNESHETVGAHARTRVAGIVRGLGVRLASLLVARFAADARAPAPQPDEPLSKTLHRFRSRAARQRRRG
jgi:hypothetical protein